MNNNHIENVAVDKVRFYLNNCGVFKANINSNDKSITFDGNIEVYYSENQKTDTFKGYFPLQVKGRECKTRVFNEIAKYPIQIQHLKNYKKEGGCALFLVEEFRIEEFKDPETQIFYKLFSKNDIDSLLIDKKDTQKTISIHLNRLPDNKKQFVEELNTFLDEKLMNIGDWEPQQVKDLLGILRLLYEKKELNHSAFLELRTYLKTILDLRFTSKSNWRDALIVYTKHIIDELNGRIDPFVLNYLIFEYALFLQSFGLFIKAEEEYNMSIYICSTIGEKDPLRYLSIGVKSLNNLAQIHYHMQDYKAAEKEYNEALQDYWTLASIDAEKYLPGCATTRNSIAALLIETKKFDSAEEYLFDALAIWMKYKKNYNLSYYFLSHIADICVNLSTIQKIRGNYKIAEVFLSYGLNIYMNLVNKNAETYSIYLAQTHNCIALFHNCKEIHNSEKSIDEFTKALDILKRLRKKNPDLYNSDLAKTLYYYGITYYYSANYISSKRELEESLKIFNSIYNDCPNAYNEYIEDIKEKLKKMENLLKEAEQCDSYSQKDLDVFNNKRQEIKQDYKNVVELLTKAAEQGDLTAQYNLGYCYFNGKGVKQDYKEAVKWFTKAAVQGNANAQVKMGICYVYGNGVKKDNKKAVEYFTLAAEQGHVDAQYNLGLSYFSGKGVKKDYNKAITFFILAANQGHVDAQYNLGVCYYYEKGVKQDYKKAVEYYSLAAEQGDAESQFMLGICYYNGKGVKQDFKKAVEYYSLAAEQGHVKANNNLCVCYKNGEGVEKDEKKAFVHSSLSWLGVLVQELGSGLGS